MASAPNWSIIRLWCSGSLLLCSTRHDAAGWAFADNGHSTVTLHFRFLSIFDAIEERKKKEFRLRKEQGISPYSDCRTGGSLVLFRNIFSTKGLFQPVQKFAVEFVHGNLGFRFGKARSFGTSWRRSEGQGCCSWRTGQAGPPGRLRCAIARTGTARIDVVVIFDNGHHESHGEKVKLKIRQNVKIRIEQLIL